MGSVVPKAEPSEKPKSSDHSRPKLSVKLVPPLLIRKSAAAVTAQSPPSAIPMLRGSAGQGSQASPRLSASSSL